MSLIAEHREVGHYYPGYASVYDGEAPGTYALTVCSRGTAGRALGTVQMAEAELLALATAIFDHFTVPSG